MELEDIQTTGRKSKGFSLFWPSVILIVLLGSGYFLFKTFHALNLSSPKAQTDTNFASYVDFAENFTIAFNNISYVNQDQQRAALADMMQSDLLTSYQNSFYDPQFLKMIQDNKIYITFQKITRSELVTTAPNEAAVKVIGVDLFHSDLTGSQKEKPFTYLIDVVKVADNKYQAKKVEKL
jgi:hypothetical protein